MGLVHGCALPYRKTEAALEGLEVAEFAAKRAIEKAPPVAPQFQCLGADRALDRHQLLLEPI
jgi:hypothetical protein